MICCFFQYHALGLLYHIRKYDRLAVTKLVSKFSKHSLKSPFAYCLLVSSLSLALLYSSTLNSLRLINEFLEEESKYH